MHITDQENFMSSDYFEIKGLSMSPVSVRLNFIRKVYFILLTQVLSTTFFILLSIYSESYRLFYASNSSLMVVAMLVALVSYYVLIYTDQSRKVPNNYILLGVFTVSESYSISYVGFAGKSAVLSACLITLAVTAALTYYALTTTSDVTLQGGALFVLCGAAAGLLLASLLFKSSILSLILSAVVICLYGMFIIYDTQLILGTKSNQYNIDDYILAALMLYVDILGLFLEILRLVQGSNES